MPVLLFGGRCGHPEERSLRRLEVNGRATASSGSSQGSSCSPGIGTGTEGGLQGPPRSAAAEVVRRLSVLAPSGLSEGARRGEGHPPRETAGPGAATELPSHPLAAWLPFRPSRRRASPPAPLHGDINELVHKCRHVVLECDSQQLDQQIFIQPEQDQQGHDHVLHYICPRTPIAKDQSQLLMHPGQKGLEKIWVVPEKGCPDAGLEATQRSPGHHPHRLLFSCCRAVISWMAMSSFCLADASLCPCQTRWSDDDLFKVVVCPHRVHDGLHCPPAERALGLALSPPHDALVTEAVEARHHIGGIVPAVQTDGTVLLQLRGHGLHSLWWAGGSWGYQTAPFHGRGSSRCHTRKGREATVTGQPGEGWKKWPGPSRRKPSQLPRVRFTPQLTSAAANTAPRCPGCLKLAGPGINLQRLWGRAQGAATNHPPSTPPAFKALTPDLTNTLSCSAGISHLGGVQPPYISSKGHLFPIYNLEMP